MMTRLPFIFFVLAAPLLSFGQLKTTGYVTSFGGGVLAAGGVQSMVTAGDPAASDQLATGGLYTVYPGFIPGQFIRLSFGLKKDSLVLVVLYEALGGSSWTNSSGWLSNPDLSAWQGVTVTDQRVTALDLSANNLQNQVPEVIKNLAKLVSVNLADNEIRKVPDMSTMPGLTTLDVSQNRLGFDDLIANKGIANYTYSPQKRYGFTSNDTIEAGTTHVLKAEVPGVGNKYQWVFDDFDEPAEAVEVPGATSSVLEVQDIDYSKMGAYRLQVTSDSLAGIVIETRNQNLWATTDITGKVVLDEQGTPLTDGQVNVYRIFDGPYELTDSADIAESGEYAMADAVLGDFILLVQPNNEVNDKVLQTYYVSTNDWLEADTLVLRSAAGDIDITMQQKPEPETDPLGATIQGVIETNFEEGPVDEEGARVQARRRVQRAGCSMRRRVRSGRPGEDSEYVFFAYVESDDQGRFNFTNIPAGEYRLNIQYPGVPMDPNSDITYIVGGDKQEQVFEVVATVTESGIVVEADEVLFVWKPYLKDIKLYPNPTEGVVVLDYFVNRRLEDLKLEVVSLSGAKLAVQEVAYRMGMQRTTVDMTRFETGLYFLVFTNEAGVFRRQVKITRK